MAAPRRFADARAVAQALRPSYPVYCLRPQVLARQAKRFLTQFPGEVLYAVKCNPHPLVVEALYRAGIRHFDTASLPACTWSAQPPATNGERMHAGCDCANVSTSFYAFHCASRANTSHLVAPAPASPYVPRPHRTAIV